MQKRGELAQRGSWAAQYLFVGGHLQRADVDVVNMVALDDRYRLGLIGSGVKSTHVRLAPRQQRGGGGGAGAGAVCASPQRLVTAGPADNRRPSGERGYPTERVGRRAHPIFSTS